MYYFRVLMIGFGFVLFGLVVFAGNLFFIPIVILGLNRFRGVRFFTRDLVRWAWLCYLKSLKIFRIVSYSLDSSLKYGYQKRQIIIANHPSLLDVVFLLAYIPRANCVVKPELKHNIFLCFAIQASGYIAKNDPQGLLEESKKALQAGENLIIFPEGTRTKERIQFHKAVSYLAIHNAESIRMIYIQSCQNALKKGQSWYDVPKTELAYEIDDLGEKLMGSFESHKPDSLRVRALHQYLNQIYQERSKK